MDEEIKTMILRYLLERPRAQDTLEGIVRWWVLRERLDLVVRQVERTVDELVAANLLVKRAGCGSGFLYALNRDEIPRIRELVGDA